MTNEEYKQGSMFKEFFNAPCTHNQVYRGPKGWTRLNWEKIIKCPLKRIWAIFSAVDTGGAVLVRSNNRDACLL